MIGILAGEPLRAARDVAVPVAQRDEVSSWVRDQLDRLDVASWEKSELISLNSTVSALGCDEATLPVAISGEGVLDLDGVIRWAASRDRVVICFQPLEVVDDAQTPTFLKYRGPLETRKVDVTDEVLFSSFDLTFIEGWPGRNAVHRWPRFDGPSLGSIRSDVNRFWSWVGIPPLLRPSSASHRRGVYLSLICLNVRTSATWMTMHPRLQLGMMLSAPHLRMSR